MSRHLFSTFAYFSLANLLADWYCGFKMNATNKTNSKFEQVLNSLTALEIKALLSAFVSSRGNGHDFGYSTDVKVEGCNAQANGALVSQLIQKGIICYDNEFDQIFFSWDDSEKFERAGQVRAFLLAKGFQHPELNR